MVVKCKEMWDFWSFKGFILLVLYGVFFHTKESCVLAYGIPNSRISETELSNRNHARRKLDDITGAISIDCGIAEHSSIVDAKTGLPYISDGEFINSGVNDFISSSFISDKQLPEYLKTVRSFPGGYRNCYTLRPPEGKAKIYLIRAYFMYGNYDNLNRLPEFEIYIGVNDWDRVKFDNASHVVIKEVIHVPTMDNIYVCLLNIGLGTPFISALELRHFHSATYKAENGSLILYQQRLDFGSLSNETVRYHDDRYDRIWFPSSCPQYDALRTSSPVDSITRSDFSLPSKVMQTAIRPKEVNESLIFEFDIENPTTDFYVYMHFAELENIIANQYRAFRIELNGILQQEVILKDQLQSKTVYTNQPMRGATLSISLHKMLNSTLPPILNALEIYLVNVFRQQPTDQDDANAIEDIKSTYNVARSWQGDPCLPSPAWNGLNCSNNGYEPPRIISLNLSSVGLTGQISSSFSNLKFLEHLDLSNNGLEGPVPEFLSELPVLKTLNLERNKLSGSIPSALKEKSFNGLDLRLDGNPCLSTPCKENKSVVVPIVATIVPIAVIILALIILWRYKRRKVSGGFVNSKEEGSSLKSDSRQFTFAEIVEITNNFKTIIGKGGFGTVYHGYLTDGTQVAVKMLSPTSSHGSSQFRTEAHLLMRIHHRNLASFIGYCNEGTNIGIIYEYMACGNLEQYRLDKSMEALTWKERLQIALDSAQGLEYLHHGCKPPIIHRDVKSANILLNENLQAKIADFGLSKDFPSSENRTHMSTAVVGTVGYLDPEYYTSNRLTERSDVYSFGVVLLELITGQPAIIRNPDENIHIISWVTPFIGRGDIRSAVDPRLQGNFHINTVWKFMEIAMSCVPSISIQRPTMNHVVSELKDCIDIEIAREQNSRMEGQAIRQSNSFDTITLDLESDMGPEAR